MALISVLLFAYVLFHSGSQSELTRNSVSSTINRVCYYVPSEQLTPDLIDPFLCTHILLGFASVTDGTLQPAKPTDVKTYQQLNNLKKKAPKLKTLVSIGGGAGAGGFPATVRNDTSRAAFIKQSLTFLDQYGFDGLDVDWEFPGWNGDPAEDKFIFTEFLKDFHEARLRRRGPTKLLTAAVAAVLPIIDISYEIPEMAKYVDFISIMCYDYHYYRPFFPFTGHNSALFKHHDDIVFLNTLNTAWSAERWNEAGMPKSKIMIGIPTYGHTFKLLQEDKNSLNAPTVDFGSGGGWITYPEVCAMLESNGTRVFDKESMVPYAYEGLNWASYEDVPSITNKAKWIVSEGYGGAMTWNLNSDDWSGSCDNRTKFPLHSALFRGIGVN